MPAHANGYEANDPDRPLTRKEALFVEAFAKDPTGDLKKAMEAAGYSLKHTATAPNYGRVILKRPAIAKALQLARVKLAEQASATQASISGEIPALGASAPIASAIDRKQFWTCVMYGDQIVTRDRLKASELLGKSEGDFIMRAELQGLLNISHSIPAEIPIRLKITDYDIEKEKAAIAKQKQEDQQLLGTDKKGRP